jgi:hypothetical protein
MPEDALSRNVISECGKLRLHVAHFCTSQVRGMWMTAVKGDGKGFPDLVIAGPGGMLFRELKSWTGTLSPEQAVWRDRLIEAGASWGLWSPLEWFNGTIHAELARLAVVS